jgi:hypothetical protein
MFSTLCWQQYLILKIMGKFAKLIELDFDEQVLLTVGYNDEDDKYELAIRTDVEGVTAQIKAGFKDEETALKAMNSYNQDNAFKFRNEMVVMLS